MSQQKKHIKKTKKRTKQKGLNGWQIAAIVFLTLLLILGIALLTYLLLSNRSQNNSTNIDNNTDNNNDTDVRKKASEAGKTLTEQDVKTDITVTPNKDGITTKIDMGGNTDKDLQLAVLLENSGSNHDTIVINGHTVDGSLTVANGNVVFKDPAGNTYSIGLSEVTEATYGGVAINDRTLDIMNNIHCDTSTGHIVIENCTPHVSYDSSNTLKIDYNLKNTDVKLSEEYKNVTQTGDKYYSNGTELTTQHSIISEFDSLLDQQFPDTKDQLLQDTVSAASPTTENTPASLFDQQFPNTKNQLPQDTVSAASPTTENTPASKPSTQNNRNNPLTGSYNNNERSPNNSVPKNSQDNSNNLPDK